LEVVLAFFGFATTAFASVAAKINTIFSYKTGIPSLGCIARGFGSSGIISIRAFTASF
jgi:hypothetical protein